VFFDTVHPEDGHRRRPKHVGVVNKHSYVHLLVSLYKTLTSPAQSFKNMPVRTVNFKDVAQFYAPISGNFNRLIN
jgi:hypothetical protein